VPSEHNGVDKDVIMMAICIVTCTCVSILEHRVNDKDRVLRHRRCPDADTHALGMTCVALRSLLPPRICSFLCFEQPITVSCGALTFFADTAVGLCVYERLDPLTLNCACGPTGFEH
jgi:hypothetical protein